MTQKIKTMCDICGSKCGLLVHIKEGKAVKVTGDKDDKISKGRICIKGQNSLGILYNKQRIKNPMLKIRYDNKYEWKEISWDSAIKIITDKFNQYIETFGSESIFMAYGHSKDFDHTLLIKLAIDLKIPNIVSPDYICYSPLMWGHIYTLGFFPKADINKSTKSCIFWGVNKFNTRFFEMYDIIEAQKKGMKTIVIDPRKTQHAALADIWLPIKPGTDIYLIYGFLNLIFENKLYDKEFVDKYIVGFDEIRKITAKYTPEYVGEITELDPQKIIDAVNLFMKNTPNTIVTGNTFDMNQDSFQKSRAIAMLIGLSDSLDVKGGMVDYRDEPLTYGRWPYGEKILNQFSRSVLNKRAEVENIKIPEFYNAAPQGVVNEIIAENIKIGYIQASNVVNSWPNTKKTIKALNKLEFLIVSDLFITPTTELADLILPASSFLEYEGVKQTLDGSLKIQKVIDKPYNSLPDFEMLNRIGIGLGLGEYYSKTADEFWNYCIEPSGITIEYLRKNGGFYQHIPPKQKYKKYVENGFNTDTKKIEFYSKKLRKLGADPLSISEYSCRMEDEDFDCILTTYRNKKFVNSEGKMIDELMKNCKLPVAEISIEQANKLNLKTKDVIWIETKIGKIKHILLVTDKITKNTIVAETGWWLPTAGAESLYDATEYNYNVLVSGDCSVNSEISSVFVRGIPCKITKYK